MTYNILMVGGTWSANQNGDGTYGKPSGLFKKITEAAAHALLCKNTRVAGAVNTTVYNGGKYNDLEQIIKTADKYDIVFWFANIPDNKLPKIRDVKIIAPKTMLVTSKRNDNNKYSFSRLIQRTLAAKANLSFEFAKNEKTGYFNIRVFDPLGNLWYDGCDIRAATVTAFERLRFLIAMTRKGTFKSPVEIDTQNLISDMRNSVAVNEFLSLVQDYAKIFNELLIPDEDAKRFLGNCSLSPAKNMPPQVGRCKKGMPSFTFEDFIFVSKRNIDKKFISAEHMVPVYMDGDDIFYLGDDKPSVDTPIQLALYKHLPNIRFMIHSHCYLENAVTTKQYIPCGALQEAKEVLDLIDSSFSGRNNTLYLINLKGHGSIAMSDDINKLRNLRYVSRHLPERVEKGE